ncbi:mediator of RNA polymerase II transcription subunit 25 isoform X2 [Halyomorpha halys]|uniref:mediator of RNA polymerase II transcription subunit 25 isoform X2 n=1 Tax=Halyomorpha halys TaxID=286706 RepID=UPI0006D50BC3|nr:mediator of RNA polymerase II transcription subunit 25 isoform X2 [Halyomorpha halys]
MVMGTSEICSIADVIFIIEGTAINGAYLNDMKTNYIIPTLEYFNQGSLEERDYVCESTSALYGVIIYHAADRLPSSCTDIYGPYSNPHRVLQVLEKIELIGGRGESHANVAEGFAASLVCLDDLQLRRENGANPQKHCILICNSPPYMMPVIENQSYIGNTAEQLATIFSEKNVHLSIISPRKIPLMFKLFEKAGGDLTTSQTKNYAKDPRHLVLLKGFSLPSLKERPVSPTSASAAAQHNLNVQLSSPLPSHGSPMSTPAQPQPPQPNQAAPTILQGAPVVAGVPAAAAAPRGFPPAYAPGRPTWRLTTMHQSVPRAPNYPTQPGSALIEQLTRPPSITPQFNNTTTLGATGLNSQAPQQPQMPPQQQQAAQPMQRILGTPGVIGQQVAIVQPQPPNVMPQNQQGLLPQQTGVMQQTNLQPGLMGQSQSQAGVMQVQPVAPMQQAQASQQQGQRERQTIWQGILEWLEKKAPGDSQKMTRHVPCQVSTNYKEGGEPELKADSWPQKLIMQLMPKQLIGNIGGAYLKNSKSVLFHPQACDALESLTKVMSTGYAGCVHFTSTPQCDIKVLILLYTSEKRAYLGFIPNDQVAFVDRLRKVIQHQKSTHALNRQGGAQTGQPIPGGGLAGPQVPPTSQAQLGTMLQQQQPQQQQQPIGAALVGQTSSMLSATGMQGEANQQQGSNQGGQFNTHLVEARQENLFKIQRLQQTLEAAQQQELQYKNQLEVTSNYYSQIMNQMKLQQMQENVGLQQVGQPQDQFKSQLEQEQQKQLRAQLQQQLQQQQQQQQQVRGLAPQQQPNTAQQRMMRPPISNNQLRHLLQGPQPQYRMNMGQQQMVRAGLPQAQPGQQMNSQQQQFDDVASYDFLS